MLPEQRRVVEAVEADTVGDLDEVELFLFGQDFIDVRFEERVCFEDFGADTALDAGFDLGFRAGGESGRKLSDLDKICWLFWYVLTLS